MNATAIATNANKTDVNWRTGTGAKGATSVQPLKYTQA